VKRSHLKELHYITPIKNIPSILKRGILCKNKTKNLNPASIAMQEVQDTRAKKSVPGGLPLHDYANLYFCARNPMMSKRRAMHSEICVLRVSTDVLDLPNVVVADSNAASKYTAFWPSPSGLSKVDEEWVFAEWWTDADQLTQWRKTAAKCAEVLVPGGVVPKMLIGTYVSCPESRDALLAAGFTLPVTIDAHLFFRG
jgi:hypothetical protein